MMAAGVALLAGFVDAIGFIESGGFFVSFMTGNSTRLAVGTAGWDRAALAAAAVIGLFLIGAILGALLAARAGAARSVAVLSFVTILLALAARLRMDGGDWSAIACLVLAMGSVNAALEGKDGTVVGVTYMTGTLVQMGHKIANRLAGEGDGRWLQHFLLWAALVGGAILGARAMLWSASLAYGLAILLAAVLMFYALRLLRRSA